MGLDYLERYLDSLGAKVEKLRAHPLTKQDEKSIDAISRSLSQMRNGVHRFEEQERVLEIWAETADGPEPVYRLGVLTDVTRLDYGGILHVHFARRDDLHGKPAYPRESIEQGVRVFRFTLPDAIEAFYPYCELDNMKSFFAQHLVKGEDSQASRFIAALEGFSKHHTLMFHDYTRTQEDERQIKIPVRDCNLRSSRVEYTHVRPRDAPWCVYASGKRREEVIGLLASLPKKWRSMKLVAKGTWDDCSYYDKFAKGRAQYVDARMRSNNHISEKERTRSSAQYSEGFKLSRFPEIRHRLIHLDPPVLLVPLPRLYQHGVHDVEASLGYDDHRFRQAYPGQLRKLEEQFRA